ncbi:MAG: hypothetical protein PHT48_05775 [Dechloromonas sp.]|nr:hypothetical protein [Dechloromonas sp.]
MTPVPSVQRGSALISAIIILLLFASLSAAMLNLSLNQATALAQDVQGARALQAARAGIELGLYHVLDPTHSSTVTPGSANWPQLPDCPSLSPLSLDDFTVNISCNRFPAGSPGYYEEYNSRRKFRIFEITATATFGTLGTPGHVERQMRTTVTKCRDESGDVKRGYDCL